MAGVTGDIVDPDVDPVPPRRESPAELARAVAVVAVGGAVGSLARYSLTRAWPARAGTLPWSTLVINAAGCLLIGILMVLVTEVYTVHRLVRPFLGVGILGGFTTFSAYAEQSRALLAAHRELLALGYLAGTLVAALLAVQLGIVLTRGLTS
jgi:CrcB protein